MWLRTLLMLSQTFSQTPRVTQAQARSHGCSADSALVSSQSTSAIGPSTVVMISPNVMSFGSRASM